MHTTLFITYLYVCIYIYKDICDLLREKGPTAVKRRFKMQLTAFSL